MIDPLDVIRRRIEQGEQQRARRALISFVRQRPDSIPAWIMLAGLLSDPVQQANCYRRILELDPSHAQAAASLQHLTETSNPPVAALRCPQCGGKLVVHVVNEMKDKRAACQHCGTEIDLPDVYRRVEHQHEQERHATHTRTVDRTLIETRSDYPEDPELDELARQALGDWEASDHGEASQDAVDVTRERHAEIGFLKEEELRPWLQERRLPDVDPVIQRMQESSDERQMTLKVDQADGQVRFWPSLLKWFQGVSRGTVRGRNAASQPDARSLLLSPEELIEAAGGPLPPEERRKCPECGTTVPKQAPSCGWCGMRLSQP